MRPRVTVIVIAGLFIAQAIIRFDSDIIHDAAWYLHMAQGLLRGKRLYTDFIEVNPPLAIWLTVPIVWLGELTGLGPVKANFAVLLLLSAGTLFLVNRYLRLIRDVPELARAVLCIMVAAALLFMPALNFAEREHLMVLLFLPWSILRFARARPAKLLPSGADPGIIESTLVGVMAAAAICFKPQSLPAPLCMELVLLLRFKNLRGLFAAENIAAGIFAAAYCAAIAVFEPGFLSVMLELGIKAYMPFYGFPAPEILFNSRWAIIFTLLAVTLRRRVQGPLSDLAELLAAGAAGFIVSYFIQNKGFTYQILPALIFAGVSGGAAIAGLLAQEKPAKRPLMTNLSVGALGLVAALNYTGAPQAYYGRGQTFEAGIARYAPDAGSFFVASTNVSHGFPLGLKRGLVWASRLPAQWLAPYVASKWQGGKLPEDPVIAKALDWTVADLVNFRPDIIFINENTVQSYVPGGRFDYVKFWSHDPRFAPFWAGYELRAVLKKFAIYVPRGRYPHINSGSMDKVKYHGSERSGEKRH